jgi:transcriptional regulator GlxA family with amidase domain
MSYIPLFRTNLTTMLRIGFVVTPHFQMMSLAATSAFEAANFSSGESLYEIHVLSERGGKVISSIGAAIDTEPLGRMRFDTLIILGVLGFVPSSARLLESVRRAPQSCRRVASICTGAFILAEAGLLDGRRATTHWYYARQLLALFPKVKMEEDRIFTVDGPIWTSAGMSAGIDLVLEMIERDCGAELARAVAQKLVMYQRRAGGQSQHSTLLELEAKSDRIQTALTFAKSNLRKSLSVEDLAAAAHLSPRQFSRIFRAETGQSPAKAVENLRVEAARLLVEQSDHSMDGIAEDTGFADPERMRRSFLRAFAQPPQVLRRNARISV